MGHFERVLEVTNMKLIYANVFLLKWAGAQASKCQLFRLPAKIMLKTSEWQSDLIVSGD